MSMPVTDISKHLAGIVGPSFVIGDPAGLAAYKIEGKVPGVAARPATSEEVAELVKFAAAEKLAIMPMGARTKLGMIPSLNRYDLAIDMTRLDRVVAYDPDDLTLGVEPGVPLSRIAGVLAGHKQFLPLAVPFLNRATVGGTIASGVDSPLRQFFGTARDYVLGMEFVTGDGTLAKSGGRVVKNVSGYDLHKLMIGSMGSLGVITQINFRTFPSLAATRVFIAAVDSAARAIELRHRVAQSPLSPLTMDILSPRAAELLSSSVAARTEPSPIPANVFAPSHWSFVVSYAGTENVLARYERDLREMAHGANVALCEDSVASAALGRVREFIPIALESSAATAIIKISVLPSRVRELLDDASRIAEKMDVPWAAVARGVGVIYYALLPGDRSEETRQRVQRTVAQLIEACDRLSGNAAILACPAEWKGSLPAPAAQRGDFEQMQKVKKVFDPGGNLAPALVSKRT